VAAAARRRRMAASRHQRKGSGNGESISSWHLARRLRRGVAKNSIAGAMALALALWRGAHAGSGVA